MSVYTSMFVIFFGSSYNVTVDITVVCTAFCSVGSDLFVHSNLLVTSLYHLLAFTLHSFCLNEFMLDFCLSLFSVELDYSFVSKI